LVPVITDVNPFVYSHPIAPDDVIDRDDETRELLSAAVGGHYVRLYGPRKYGKTSLLRRVLRDGERDEGLIPILVDLYGVLSIADAAIRFERAYARQLKGKIRTRVEEFLQSTGLGLSLGALEQIWAVADQATVYLCGALALLEACLERVRAAHGLTTTTRAHLLADLAFVADAIQGGLDAA